MDQESELAVVERLRGGDQTAFDTVYDAFNQRLFTFLLRLSRLDRVRTNRSMNRMLPWGRARWITAPT